MKNKLWMLSIIFLLFVNISWAQESPLTITNMKAEPDIVNTGGKVLITCQVDHTQGAMLIRKVAATIYHGERVTAYPVLYDDGTNGDTESGDGIYSLEIEAGDNACIAQIVFHAVDSDGNEIDSDPISITIE